MRRRPPGRLAGALIVLCICVATSGFALAQGQSAEYRGTLRVVKHDISPPLREIPPLPLPFNLDNWGGSIVDPPGTEGQPQYGRQTPDEAMQSTGPSQDIPGPAISFTAITNAGFSPPDPVGDIGPDHYVTMSNVYFVVHDRTGNLLAGPHPNNMLWSGFGGECETQNAGDPIVLYDQFADRWLLTQFTNSAEEETGEYYNCVAVSTGPDPTDSYYRYQIANNGLFSDYPKYGVGEDAYYISTRDFTRPPLQYVGVGAYAMNRAQMVAGDPSPAIVAYTIDRSNPEIDPEIVGDGLLPMDIDGFDMPPAGSPHYYIGSMDDGGPYGADQDALTVWEFVVDFATPENSSFTLTATVPMSPYDTVFPCIGMRGCIPQPDTTNRVDHQGYRQRPLHRAAYRNFGTHESLVTLQSVEADPGIAGMRWWEIRDFATTPAIHQEGTFAPGNEDGIHRWFGSIAQDSAGNMAIGYSASNETTYPSVWYSGRLATDTLGTMPQGEGSIVNGTGSQTGNQRWGDYSSMNVDPADDCTFWYVNEWVPNTSSSGWVLQVGSFRFEECGDPGFALSVTSSTTASVCTGDEATYDLNVGSIAEFDMPVHLSATGHPGGTSANFDPNPVTPLPGTSTLTIGNTGGASAGDYDIQITGMADGADDRTADAQLTVWDAVPGTPDLAAPADMATDQSLNPTFEWTGTNFEEFVIEVATDSGFTNILLSEPTTETSFTPVAPLSSTTTYYWRVRGVNTCGPGADSDVFSFTTQSLPGHCPAGQTAVVAHLFDFETGDQGWTSGANVGSNTWTLSGANPNSGAQHWHVDDVDSQSDQFLASPAMAIPSDLNELTFRFFDFQAFEAPPGSNECWDGGVLEVSTNGGTDFVEVVNADLLTNPYDGVLRGTSGNPLAGRDAWCETAQPYTDSRVDISGLAGKEDVVFRFRIGTDAAVGAPGWDIDDVKVVGCSPVPVFQDSFETPDS